MQGTILTISTIVPIREASMSSPEFTATIIERRRDLGLRQAEVAELAGVSVRFINELEHGKPTVRLDKVQAVLAVLGLALELKIRDEPQR
jgi:HTH-type transcriptional regulator/antitoxin HipB